MDENINKTGRDNLYTAQAINYGKILGNVSNMNEEPGTKNYRGYVPEPINNTYV